MHDKQSSHKSTKPPRTCNGNTMMINWKKTSCANHAAYHWKENRNKIETREWINESNDILNIFFEWFLLQLQFQPSLSSRHFINSSLSEMLATFGEMVTVKWVLCSMDIQACHVRQLPNATINTPILPNACTLYCNCRSLTAKVTSTSTCEFIDHSQDPLWQQRYQHHGVGLHIQSMPYRCFPPRPPAILQLDGGVVAGAAHCVGCSSLLLGVVSSGCMVQWSMNQNRCNWANEDMSKSGANEQIDSCQFSN